MSSSASSLAQDDAARQMLFAGAARLGQLDRATLLVDGNNWQIDLCCAPLAGHLASGAKSIQRASQLRRTFFSPFLFVRLRRRRIG